MGILHFLEYASILSGSAFKLYALFFFSPGTLNYSVDNLSLILNISKPTIYSALKELKENELINDYENILEHGRELIG